MGKSFKNVISELGALLEGRVRTPILVGGWAVNQLGFARNTLDFDLMIFEDEYPVYWEVLNKLGYKEMVKTTLYARFSSEKEKYLPVIDILFANKSTYDKIAADGGIVNFLGMELVLPKVEHIIAMKLHAVKYGEGYRGSKDYIDIIELMKANSIDSTSKNFEEICLKYGGSELYRRIINEFS